VVRLRLVTIALLALWAVLGIVAVVDGLRPPTWVTLGLAGCALYFLLFGLIPFRRKTPVA